MTTYSDAGYGSSSLVIPTTATECCGDVPATDETVNIVTGAGHDWQDYVTVHAPGWGCRA